MAAQIAVEIAEREQRPLGDRATSRGARTGTRRCLPGESCRTTRPQAVRDVCLEGLEAREVVSLMMPPRLVGSGLVPAAPA